MKVKRMSEQHPKADEVKVGHDRASLGSLADAAKAIFLVGGFGSSEYLKHSLQTVHPDIQVIQPHDAWSAIVK